jgi:hypothetical protein
VEIAAGTDAPLGLLLVEQGALKSDALEQALSHQEEAGGRLGEILLEQGLVSRPLLARVLSRQHGVTLEMEEGFGSGLRGLIERRHLERMGLSAAAVGDGDEEPPLRLVERRIDERRRLSGRRRDDA